MKEIMKKLLMTHHSKYTDELTNAEKNFQNARDHIDMLLPSGLCMKC